MERKDGAADPLRRLQAGFLGLLFGAVLGLLALLLAIMVANATFGLTNIWPGAVVGAGLGLLIGVVLPDAVMAAYHKFGGGD